MDPGAPLRFGQDDERVGSETSQPTGEGAPEPSGAGAGGVEGALRRRGQRIAQRLLAAMVERGLQHHAARALDRLQHLVAGHLVDQQEQRGIARLEIGGELLHEVVIDAVIGQRPAERARRRAERRPEHRHQEDRADQQTPERARDGAERRGVEELVQLDLAALMHHGDGGIADLDQIFLLQRDHFLAHLLGAGLGRVDDDDEIGHGGLPGAGVTNPAGTA